MSWVKIDDQMPRHPKLLGLGRDRLICQGVWMDGMCYASAYLTDGLVPVAALEKGTERYADKLVKVGLWSRHDGGYRIHDYLDYQPSRDEVLEQRRRNALRQSRHRNGVSNEGSNGVTNGDSNPVSNNAPARPGPAAPANAGDAREIDELEIAVHRLRNGNATVKQIDTFRGLREQIDDDPAFYECLREWAGAPVKDRLGKAMAELVDLAARHKSGRGSKAVKPTTNYDVLMESDDEPGRAA